MHFYPFTGQATLVPVNALIALGVPAITVAALVLINAFHFQEMSPGKEGRHA